MASQRFFLLQRKNLLCKISYFQYVYYELAEELPQFSFLFFRTLEMVVEKVTKHAMFHMQYDHFQHLVFQVLPGHLVFTVLSCIKHNAPSYYSPYSMPERLPEYKRMH